MSNRIVATLPCGKRIKLSQVQHATMITARENGYASNGIPTNQALVRMGLAMPEGTGITLTDLGCKAIESLRPFKEPYSLVLCVRARNAKRRWQRKRKRLQSIAGCGQPCDVLASGSMVGSDEVSYCKLPDVHQCVDHFICDGQGAAAMVVGIDACNHMVAACDSPFQKRMTGDSCVLHCSTAFEVLRNERTNREVANVLRSAWRSDR